jgi:hypothetical protein
MVSQRHFVNKNLRCLLPTPAIEGPESGRSSIRVVEPVDV